MIATERLHVLSDALSQLCSPARAWHFSASLIGLGGAEFRLPPLMAVFALYPHRAIHASTRCNQLGNLGSIGGGTAEFPGGCRHIRHSRRNSYRC